MTKYNGTIHVRSTGSSSSSSDGDVRVVASANRNRGSVSGNGGGQGVRRSSTSAPAADRALRAQATVKAVQVSGCAFRAVVYCFVHGLCLWQIPLTIGLLLERQTALGFGASLKTMRTITIQ